MKFADDILLITDNVEELREMLNELNEAREAVEPNTNFKNMPVMINNAINKNSEIKVDRNTSKYYTLQSPRPAYFNISIQRRRQQT